MGPFERGSHHFTWGRKRISCTKRCIFIFYCICDYNSVSGKALYNTVIQVSSLPEYYTVLTGTQRRFEGSHFTQLQTQNSPIRTQLHWVSTQANTERCKMCINEYSKQAHCDGVELAPVNSFKAYSWNRCVICSFLISAPNGGHWSTSLHGRLIPGGNKPVTRWIRSFGAHPAS